MKNKFRELIKWRCSLPGQGDNMDPVSISARLSVEGVEKMGIVTPPSLQSSLTAFRHLRQDARVTAIRRDLKDRIASQPTIEKILHSQPLGWLVTPDNIIRPIYHADLFIASEKRGVAMRTIYSSYKTGEMLVENLCEDLVGARFSEIIGTAVRTLADLKAIRDGKKATRRGRT